MDSIYSPIVNFVLSSFLLGVLIFKTQIVNKLGEFDIALCEGGIFGPIATNYVYGIGKSAIDIGDILPLYFGLWTNSDMKSKKEIIQLYLNEYWKKL